MGVEVWQCMRGLATVLTVRPMPTAGVAQWDEIPKPSAEGLWGQELGWSQSLGEGLIYSPMTAICNMAQQSCGTEECVASLVFICIA